MNILGITSPSSWNFSHHFLLLFFIILVQLNSYYFIDTSSIQHNKEEIKQIINDNRNNQSEIWKNNTIKYYDNDNINNDNKKPHKKMVRGRNNKKYSTRVLLNEKIKFKEPVRYLLPPPGGPLLLNPKRGKTTYKDTTDKENEVTTIKAIYDSRENLGKMNSNENYYEEENTNVEGIRSKNTLITNYKNNIQAGKEPITNNDGYHEQLNRNYGGNNQSPIKNGESFQGDERKVSINNDNIRGANYRAPIRNHQDSKSNVGQLPTENGDNFQENSYRTPNNTNQEDNKNVFGQLPIKNDDNLQGPNPQIKNINHFQGTNSPINNINHFQGTDSPVKSINNFQGTNSAIRNIDNFQRTNSKINHFQGTDSPINNMNNFQGTGTDSPVKSINNFQGTNSAIRNIDNFHRTNSKINIFQGTDSPINNINNFQGTDSPVKSINNFQGTNSAIRNIDNFQGTNSKINNIKNFQETDAPVRNINNFQVTNSAIRNIDNFQGTNSKINNINNFQGTGTDSPVRNINNFQETNSAIRNIDNFQGTNSQNQNINNFEGTNSPINNNDNFQATYSQIKNVDNFQGTNSKFRNFQETNHRAPINNPEKIIVAQLPIKNHENIQETNSLLIENNNFQGINYIDPINNQDDKNLVGQLPIRNEDRFQGTNYRAPIRIIDEDKSKMQNQYQNFQQTRDKIPIRNNDDNFYRPNYRGKMDSRNEINLSSVGSSRDNKLNDWSITSQRNDIPISQINPSAQKQVTSFIINIPPQEDHQNIREYNENMPIVGSYEAISSNGNKNWPNRDNKIKMTNRGTIRYKENENELQEYINNRKDNNHTIEMTIREETIIDNRQTITNERSQYYRDNRNNNKEAIKKTDISGNALYFNVGNDFNQFNSNFQYDNEGKILKFENNKNSSKNYTNQKFQEDDPSKGLEIAESKYFSDIPNTKEFSIYETATHGIPGKAGKDYPTHEKRLLGNKKFSCRGLDGYFADKSTQCQVFYICNGEGAAESMLCPNGTLFNQELLVCDWWYNVEC